MYRTVLGSGNTAVNKTDKSTALREFIVHCRERGKGQKANKERYNVSDSLQCSGVK